MIRLVEGRLAADVLARVDHGGIGKLPANAGLGRAGHRTGHHEEGIVGGRREVARENDKRLRGITQRRRIRIFCVWVPTNFVQSGILGRRLNLVGSLALNVNGSTGRHIRGGGTPIGNRLLQRDHDVAGRRGRGVGVNHEDARACAHIRAVHHEIVSNLRIQAGRDGDNERGQTLGNRIAHLAKRANDGAVGQSGRAAGNSVGPLINGGEVEREGDGHRDFLVQMLLKCARRGDGIVRQDVLADDLGGHHHDCRDGAQQQEAHGQRSDDFDQREGARGTAPAGGSRCGQHHGTRRVTVMLWVCERPLIEYSMVNVPCRSQPAAPNVWSKVGLPAEST